MGRKYQELITDYCHRHGIAIPPGFGRNAPSRYAIVRLHCEPPKLIALTFFKTTDVLNYIRNNLEPELGESLVDAITILDFQQMEKLRYTGGKKLYRVETFDS